MKQIKNNELELSIDPDFDIWTEPGKTRTYKKVDITLGRKNYHGVWHYWWIAKPYGEPHGYVYLTDASNPEMTKLAYLAAKNLINIALKAGQAKLKEMGEKK